MNKIVNKTIVGLLIPAVFFSTSLQAKSFWSDSTFTNITTPGVATDPNTGIRYMSGGSYTLKFKNAQEFPPMFSAEGPELKVGCGGIGFNLGFASLINFEQLASQLQQAGASFAWGILIGLAYSLPALKQVFKDINDWAAFLQNLLANSCNIGKSIAMKYTHAKENREISNEWVQDHTPEFLKTSLDNAEQFMEEFIKDGKMTSAAKGKIADEKIDILYTRHSGGIISSFLTQLVKNGVEENVVFPAASGSQGYTFDEKDLEDSKLSKSSQISVLILSRLVSDIILDYYTMKIMKDYTKAVQSGDNIQYAAAMKNIDSSLNSPSPKISKNNNALDINGLIMFFLNGSDSKLVEDLSEQYQQNIVLITHRYKTGGVEHSILLGGEGGNKYTTLAKGWKGLKAESSEAFARIVNITLNQISKGDIVIADQNMPIFNASTYDLIKRVLIIKKPRGAIATVDDDNIVRIAGFPEIEELIIQMSRENAYAAVSMLFDGVTTAINATTRPANSMIYGPKTKTDAKSSDDLANMKKLLHEKLGIIQTELREKRKKATTAIKTIMDQITLDRKIKEIVGEKKGN